MTENLTVAWLTGRNICRRHCMDLVSIGRVINSRFEMVHYFLVMFQKRRRKMTSSKGEFYKVARDSFGHQAENVILKAATGRTCYQALV